MTSTPRETPLRLVRGGVTANPSHDDRIEDAVIGSMLVSAEALAYVAEREVLPRHFYRTSRAVIFATILDMRAEGCAIDQVTVSAALRAKGRMVDAGGESAVFDLFTVIPTGANIATYVAALVRLYTMRCREQSAMEALQFMQNGQMERARELFAMAAKPVEEIEEPENPLVTEISDGYCVFNGCYAIRVFKNGSEEQPKPITNFTISILCEELTDDGAGGTERRIRFNGRMATGIPLSERTIPAKDWTQVSTWLHDVWGHKPVIHCQPHILLKVVALQHQNTAENRMFTHTGWTTKLGPRPVFLTPHGPRGGAIDTRAFEETCRVSTPTRLAPYNIPETVTPEQVTEAFAWIERLLLCGDAAVTAPLVSAMFLAPLASFINLDFALFVTGHTGTHKSSFAAACMALWGKGWTKDALPTSFIATANAIELLGFRAKDLPLVIDNYVPDRGGDRLSEATRTLKRISHSLGDHQGRDRLTADSEEKSAKPFRSLCIITGEDMPFAAGGGATNRYYIVPMTRESLKLRELESVQEAGWAGKLAPAMTHYINFIASKMEDPTWVSRVIAHHYKLEREARRVAAGKDHDRLTSQTAWIQVGLELARSAHPSRVWLTPGLGDAILPALNEALAQRRSISRQASLSYRFLTGLQYLVQSGIIHGVQASDGAPPAHKEIAALIGWDAIPTAPYFVQTHRGSRCAIWLEGFGDGWRLCVKGNEIVTEIKQRIRMECPIVEGVTGVAAALASDGLIQAAESESDRYSTKMSLWNGQRPRVWKLDGQKVLEILGIADAGVHPPAI